jgi:hypothetical protein
LKEKKTDAERISLINSPIDGTKQYVFQKKLNIIKYSEIVDTKIKEENAPLFRNHKPLKIPDPKKRNQVCSIQEKYLSQNRSN